MAKESWYWLANGLGFGAVNSGDVLAACPTGADEVVNTLGSEFLDELLTQKQAERLAQSRPEDFALQIHQAHSQGVQVVTYEDESYPEALRSIHNPPLMLFVKGDKTLLNGQLALGMVGARRPSAYGVEAARAIGRGLALGGAIIVSGLAAGLDAEAHKAALAVNGPTVACIAFGHEHCYPAANRKLMEVIQRNGAVISEYPPNTSPEKPYFLQRNRIIAGFSHGLVVVEARRHSGTMSTVNFAVDYGRDVFAVPGSIFSELSGGTNAMIQEGAYVASSATDVLAVYGIKLKDEDPVVAAAKQAQEGRPAPANAASPWQQSAKKQSQAQQLPLGEMLRNQLGENTGEVSAAQAVSAFRALQNSMPAATESELNARNRALDEMVQAVSDTVQISPEARSKHGAVQKPEPKPSVPQLFPWHQVERLEKSEVRDLSPVQGKTSAKYPKLPERFLAGKQPELSHEKQVIKPAFASAKPEEDDVSAALKAPPSHSFLNKFEMPAKEAKIESEATQTETDEEKFTPAAIEPMRTEALLKTENLSEDVTLPQPQFVPKPVAERKEAKPKADSTLSGRLKTMQTPAGKPQENYTEYGMEKMPKPSQQTLLPYTNPLNAGRMGMPASPLVRAQFTAPVPVFNKPDTSLLSGTAKDALAQLSQNPLSLADICEKSGLSSGGAMAALTELELAGLSRQLPGRQFVRL